MYNLEFFQYQKFAADFTTKTVVSLDSSFCFGHNFAILPASLKILFHSIATVLAIIEIDVYVYKTVVWCVLVPGLRKHGILQKVTSVIKEKLAALRSKTQEKAKTN